MEVMTTDGISDLKNRIESMRQVAELYCQIFSEEPWEESYDAEQVLKTMTEHFARLGAETLTFVENGTPIGFAWMYEISKNDLREGTRYLPALDFLFKDGKRVFYFQEVGVKKGSRRQGIGERLTRELLQRAKERGVNFVILSTSRKATPIRSMIQKIGFRDSGIIRLPAELNRTYWFFEF